MKKLLALVLALVMSMSLVTISNAAFKDADKISNKEAVDVMAAVGVLAGYDNGEFGATDTLTRAQACKIIAYLDLGKDVAEALPAVQVFSDLPANNWAAKYVAYCADAGYVSGVGDNKFAPDEKVTGYQFGKMLLCALGYDATIEEMTGANWTIKVAKLMESNDLTKGTSKLGSANLTREEAAQYALNALKATTVDYENKGTDINLGDIGSITVGASKAKAVESKSEAYKAALGNGGTIELGEKLYKGDLVLTSDAKDAFGRTANKWEYKKDAVGTYVTDSADKTYYGTVSGKTIYNDLSLSSSTKYTLNGEEKTGAEIKALSSDFGGYSYVVEVTIKDKAITVISVEYKYGVISKVTKAKDDVKRSVTIDGKSFETESFAKDDKVLYTVAKVDGKDKIQSVQLAEKITGKVTAVKSDKVTIDGTAYKTNVSEIKAAGTEGTYYLGIDGSIVGASDLVAVVSAKDFMYIYNVVDGKTDEVDEDGMSVANKSTAYYVLADGTKGSAKFDPDKQTEIKKGSVIAYKINSDDLLEIAIPSEDVKASTSITASEVAIGKKTTIVDGFYMNDATQFVFVNVDETEHKLTISSVTGYKNVGEQSAKVFVIADKDSKALTVFVFGKDAGVETDKTYAYLLDTTATAMKDDKDKDLYIYDVMIDGEISTISTSDKAYMKGIAVGDRFSYVLKDGKLKEAAVKDTSGVVSGEIKAIVEDYVVINVESEDKTYSIEKDAEVYLLDAKADDIKNVLVSDAFEKGDTVTIYTNGKTGDDLKYVAVVITEEAE